jgi:fimbrial chaperone protein
MNIKLGGGAALTAVLPLLLSWQSLFAGSFAISPLRVEFTPGNETQVVRITNEGQSSLSIQVQGFRWSQAPDGDDRFEPAESLVAVPTVFSVEPGQRQIVRVGTLDPTFTDVEQSFRLFFTELARPDSESGPGVSMRLRVSIPAFVAPADGPRPRLRIERFVRDGDAARITLRNTGNQHVQIRRLSLHAGPSVEGDVVESAGGIYLLPGTERTFSHPSLTVPGATTIRLEGDTTGTLEYAIPMGP